MKRLCVAGFMGFFFLVFGNRIQAQSSAPPSFVIDPYPIALSYYMTTNLIFPYPIKSVDRGSDAIIVQKAKGVENILQIKADKKDFEPTNLSIVTANGQFYSFILDYEDRPLDLNYSFAGDKSAQLAGQVVNMHELERQSFQVLGMFPFIRLQRIEQSLRFQLHGIFHSENTLWMKLKLYNDAQVDFKPAYVRFFLHDKKRIKRMALHEMEIFPIYMPDNKNVNGKGSAVWTVGFKPFTVPKKKRLIVQIGDESGGRVIQLPIKGRLFLGSKKIPS